MAIMKLPSFRRASFSGRRWIQTAEGISELPMDGRGDITSATSCIIVSRQLAVYRFIDLSAVPLGLRDKVLSQKVERLSPFKNYGRFSVSTNGGAQVWLWDEDRLARDRERADLPVSVGVLPEPLFHSRLADGVGVQTCGQGFELQCWQGGVLTHSQWVADKPGAAVTDQFVRAMGGKLDSFEWLWLEPIWSARPWSDKPFWSRENLTSEPVLTKFMAAVLAGWLMFQLGLGLGSQLSFRNLSESVAQKRDQLMDLVTQRETALSLQAVNQGYLSLLEEPTQLWLAAQLHELLKGNPFLILDWQYQRGTLKVLLQQANLDTRQVLESLSGNRSFTDVRVEPGLLEDQTLLTISLADLAELRGDDG